MRLCWETASEVLDKISLTNRGWHTRKAERGTNNYAIKASNEHRFADESVVQENVQLRTNIGFLAK